MDRITDIYIEPRIGGWAVLAERAGETGPVAHVMESGLSLERAYGIVNWMIAMGHPFQVADAPASEQPALGASVAGTNDSRPLLCA